VVETSHVRCNPALKQPPGRLDATFRSSYRQSDWYPFFRDMSVTSFRPLGRCNSHLAFQASTRVCARREIYLPKQLKVIRSIVLTPTLYHNRQLASTIVKRTMSSQSAAQSFYNLKAELPRGDMYDFNQLKGKVVLVVNVASQWCVPTSSVPLPSFIDASLLFSSGFTPQYKGASPMPRISWVTDLLSRRLAKFI